MTLPVGTRLMTLDGTVFGNAIVIEVTELGYRVETDFGNLLAIKTMQEIDTYWSYDLEEEVDIERWYSERSRLVNRTVRGGMVELVDAADLKFAG